MIIWLSARKIFEGIKDHCFQNNRILFLLLFENVGGGDNILEGGGGGGQKSFDGPYSIKPDDFKCHIYLM